MHHILKYIYGLLVIFLISATGVQAKDHNSVDEFIRSALQSQINKNRGAGNKEYIIRVSGREGTDNRIRGIYRKQDDALLWSYSQLQKATSLLQAANRNSNLECYLVFAAVYKFSNVADSIPEYNYQQLANNKGILEKSGWSGDDKKQENFEWITNGIEKAYPVEFDAKNGKKILAYVITTYFYTDGGPNKGHILHHQGVLHGNIAPNKIKHLLGTFLGISDLTSSNKYTVVTRNLENMLKQYAQPVKTKLRYSAQGAGANSYIHKLSEKVKNSQPKQPEQPVNGPQPYLYDYTGAVTKEDIRKALEAFQASKKQNDFTCKLYVTDARTPEDIRDSIHLYTATPKEKDIIMWLDFDEGQIPSFQFFYGSKVPQGPGLNKFEQLFVEVFKGWEMDFNPLTAMLEGISGLIGQLKIPEKYYDPEHADYNPLPGKIYEVVRWVTPTNLVLDPILQNIPIGSYSREIYTPGKMQFAFVAGAWNGAVEMVQGIPDVIILITDGDKRKELFDAFGQMKEKWDTEGSGAIFGMFWKKLKEAHTGNPCKVTAQVGKDVFDVVTLVIAFAKVGKAAKIAEFLDMIDPLTHIFKGLGKISTFAVKGAKFTYRMGSGALKATVEKSVLVIRVMRASGELLQRIDWSKVLSKAEMLTTNGERVWTGRVLLDPDGQLNDAIVRIKEIIRDEKGALQKVGDNDGMALVEVTPTGGGPATEQLAVVEDVESLASRIINSIKRFDVAGEFAKGKNPVEFYIKWGTEEFKLKWVMNGGKIEFGDRSDLRAILGATDDIEAHHILAWATGANDVVQAAARDGFHLNLVENAIGLKKYRKLIEEGMHGNHPAYNDFILHRLNEFKLAHPDFNPQSANEYIQTVLLPELKVHISGAANSPHNLNEYFKQTINPLNGVSGY